MSPLSVSPLGEDRAQAQIQLYVVQFNSKHLLFLSPIFMKNSEKKNTNVLRISISLQVTLNVVKWI